MCYNRVECEGLRKAVWELPIEQASECLAVGPLRGNVDDSIPNIQRLGIWSPMQADGTIWPLVLMNYRNKFAPTRVVEPRLAVRALGFPSQRCIRMVVLHSDRN